MDWSGLAKKVMSGIQSGLTSIKTAAGNTATAIGNVVSDAYKKAVTIPATIATIAPVASKAIAGIPEAFLKAFPTTTTTVGTALTIAGAATAAAASWGIAGYELYKTLQWKSQSEKMLAEQQANLERARKALGLIPSTLTGETPEEQTARQIKTGVLNATITDTEDKVKEWVTPAPSVVTPPAPTPTPAPTPAIIERVIEKPGAAPVVNVNVPPVPQPLQVTGPMTGVQLAGMIPFLATSVGQQVHQQRNACMGTTGSLLLENLLKALIPMGIAAGFTFNDQLRGAMTAVAQKFVDAIYSPLTAQAPITPEKGPAIGAVLLTQAVMFGSGAHILSIMAEASAPVKHMGIGYLAAFMADAAGFSRIAAAYQGMMIQVGLSGPMKYWAQARFRPEIPSEGTLLKLLGNYAITLDVYKRYMPYHGYTDDWIAKFPALAYKALSPMLFRYLGEAGLLDEAFIDAELKHAEYRPEALPYLKEWLKKVSAGELKGQFASSVTGAYRKGLLDPGALEGHLDNLGYSDKQKEKAGYAAELDFAATLAEEMRATYLQQHKLGQLTDGELAMRLSSLGYRGEKVNADVLKARAWFKPKPTPAVDPAIEKIWREAQAKYIQGYIQLYRDGYLNGDGLYESLISVRVEPEVAEATVFLESARALPKIPLE